MPCYTYKCSKCNREFEAFHMMGVKLEICSQEETTECEQSQNENKNTCDGKLIRLLSPFLRKKEIESKTGDVVKKEISDSKERIEEAKREFRREYEQ